MELYRQHGAAEEPVAKRVIHEDGCRAFLVAAPDADHLILFEDVVADRERPRSGGAADEHAPVTLGGLADLERRGSLGRLGDELSALADGDVAVQDLIEGGADVRAAGEGAHLAFESADAVEQVEGDCCH